MATEPREQTDKFLSPNQKSWRRFKRNKPALLGMAVIFLSILIAIFAHFIAPDPTPNADEQILEIATQSPGFKCEMLKLRKNRDVKEGGLLKMFNEGKDNPYQFIPIRDWNFEGDSIQVNVFTGNSNANWQSYHVADVIYPLISNNLVIGSSSSLSINTLDGTKIQKSSTELKALIEKDGFTSKRYALGTDKYGRDNLSRLILGVRVSISIGLLAALISLIIGLIVGSAAGYFRGWVDNVAMWFINVFWSIPTLLLVFAMIMALGREFWQIYLAVGLTMWVEMARIVRGQFMTIREKEYVEAANSLGFGHFRTIVKHILPNIIGPIIVITAANFATAIIIEAGLSFLGIGVQPPKPSWGVMLNEYYQYIGTSKSFLAIVPGLAIMILVLAFNLIGNGLRDAFDVKTRL